MFLYIYIYIYYFLEGSRAIQKITCSESMIQGPVHMLCTLARVWVCVSSIAGIDANTLWCWILETPPLSRFPLIHSSSPVQRNPSDHSIKAQTYTKNVPSLILDFHSSLSIYPLSPLSLSLDFLLLLSKAVTAIPNRKIPIKLQSSVYSSLFNMCIYVCMCVIEGFPGRRSAHKHVTR